MDINVEYSRIKLSNGLINEDTRSNKIYTLGTQYTDEGIYRISIKNKYTGEETTKIIYVGTSKYLKALSKNKLTVDALNNKLKNGKTVSNDGTIS